MWKICRAWPPCIQESKWHNRKLTPSDNRFTNIIYFTYMYISHICYTYVMCTLLLRHNGRPNGPLTKAQNGQKMSDIWLISSSVYTYIKLIIWHFWEICIWEHNYSFMYCQGGWKLIFVTDNRQQINALNLVRCETIVGQVASTLWLVKTVQ